MTAIGAKPHETVSLDVELRPGNGHCLHAGGLVDVHGARNAVAPPLRNRADHLDESPKDVPASGHFTGPSLLDQPVSMRFIPELLEPPVGHELERVAAHLTVSVG